MWTNGRLSLVVFLIIVTEAASHAQGGGGSSSSSSSSFSLAVSSDRTITFSLPDSEGWEAFKTNSLSRMDPAGDALVLTFQQTDPCAKTLDQVQGKNRSVRSRPSGYPSGWHGQVVGFRDGTNHTEIACVDVDLGLAMTVVIGSGAAIDASAQGLASTLSTVETAFRRAHLQIPSYEYISPPGFAAFAIGAGTWWHVETTAEDTMIWEANPALPVHTVSLYPGDETDCDAWRRKVAQQPSATFDVPAPWETSGITMVDAQTGNQARAVCAVAAVGTVMAIWQFERGTTDAEIQSVVDAVLAAAATAIAPRTTTTYTPSPDPYADPYAADPYGAGGYGAPYAEPSPGPASGGGRRSPGSSVRDVDLRAGAALLSPATGEDGEGFAAGVALPIRFLQKHVAIEARGMVTYSSDLGTSLDVHLGAGVGIQRKSFAVAWTGGAGYDDWGGLDPGMGGPHVYTGPAAKLGNDRLVLDFEASFLLGSGPTERRLRLDLATGAWARKLVIGVERTSHGDAATSVVFTAGVGLGGFGL